ncbi:MAG TPA: GlsB/YeaQ/YmgE family stress response membrane protein [Paracoccus sp.]|nr:GlsB/YeaQ/YmgE family stress response membrane protein [Paracoccus sp. (in: a-proteobacteria)]
MIGGVLLLILIGAAAGYVATRLMRMPVDLPTAMGIGVLGAVIGGLGLRMLLTAGGWAMTFALALLGSLALIWIWQKLSSRR